MRSIKTTVVDMPMAQWDFQKLWKVPLKAILAGSWHDIFDAPEHEMPGVLGAVWQRPGHYLTIKFHDGLKCVIVYESDTEIAPEIFANLEEMRRLAAFY